MELKLESIYNKAKENISYIKKNKEIFSTVKDKDIVERIIKEHLYVINQVNKEEFSTFKQEIFSDINIEDGFLDKHKSLIDMSDEINYFDFYLKNVFKIEDQSMSQSSKAANDKPNESFFNTSSTGTSQINPANAFNSILIPGKNSIRSPDYYPFSTKPKVNWYLRISIYVFVFAILALNVARIIMNSTFAASVAEIKVDDKVYSLGFLSSEGLFNLFLILILLSAPFNFFRMKKYDRFKYYTSNNESSSWFFSAALSFIKLFFISSTTFYWYFNQLPSIQDVDQANIIRSLFSVDITILCLIFVLVILTIISRYLNPKIDTERVKNDTQRELEEISKKIGGGV